MSLLKSVAMSVIVTAVAMAIIARIPPVRRIVLAEKVVQ